MKVHDNGTYRLLIIALVAGCILIATAATAATLDITNPENQSPTGLDFPFHPANYYNVSFTAPTGMRGVQNAIFVVLDQDSHINPDNFSPECVFISANDQFDMNPWAVAIVDPRDEVPGFPWPDGVDQALKMWVPVDMIIPTNFPVTVNITCGIENPCPVNCSGDFVWVFTDTFRNPVMTNSELLRVTVDAFAEGPGVIDPMDRTFYFACEDATFEITPDDGVCNVLEEVDIDGEPIELVNQTTDEFDFTLFADGSAELTFNQLTCSHTVEATFTPGIGTIFGSKLDEETEEGLPDWEINLFDETGTTLIESQLTDENGDYEFTGLCPGTYLVNETLQEGWELVSPEEGFFIVTVTEENPDQGPFDFVNRQINGTIFGFKLDEETGEGLADWQINLFDETGTTLIDTEVTGEDGSYDFSELEFGTYIVNETLKEGWELVSPEEGFFTVTLNEEDPVAGPLNFTNVQEVQTGTIFGFKLNEETGVGLADWQINLFDETGTTLIDTEVTDEDGFYDFSELEFGTYIVNETLKEGWELVSPEEGFFTVTLDDENPDAGPLNFTNELEVETGTIFGFKLNGETGDGLGGWQINLFDENGTTLIDTEVTDEDGFYDFTELEFGTYIVNETLQEGWVLVSPEEGFFTVTLNEENPLVGPLEFVNVPAEEETELSGMKFSDVNQNGRFDPPLDYPLPGWTIQLKFPNNNTVFMTDVTDENGEYEFMNIPFGQWKITEVGKPFWVQTAPKLQGNFVRFWLVELNETNPVIEDLDFGNKFIPFDPPFPTFGEILKNYTAESPAPTSQVLNFTAYSARDLLLGFAKNLPKFPF